MKVEVVRERGGFQLKQGYYETCCGTMPLYQLQSHDISLMSLGVYQCSELNRMNDDSFIKEATTLFMQNGIV